MIYLIEILIGDTIDSYYVKHGVFVAYIGCWSAVGYGTINYTIYCFVRGVWGVDVKFWMFVRGVTKNEQVRIRVERESKSCSFCDNVVIESSALLLTHVLVLSSNSFQCSWRAFVRENTINALFSWLFACLFLWVSSYTEVQWSNLKMQ